MEASGQLPFRSGRRQPSVKPFLDTNILIYVASSDARQGTARAVLGRGGIVSVHVLNEFANAARRKQMFRITAVRKRVILYWGFGR
jgi:predicted nucleic acid-binding protein